MTVRRLDASSSRVTPLLDLDLFSPSHVPRALHCRSSRLSRWLSELQTPACPDALDLSDVDPVGTQSNPYLAYPHMSMAALGRSLDDVDSMHDYVIIDQDIAQECPPQASVYDQVRYLGLLGHMPPNLPITATS